jgi:hypothetical protein
MNQKGGRRTEDPTDAADHRQVRSHFLFPMSSVVSLLSISKSLSLIFSYYAFRHRSIGFRNQIRV